MMDDETKKKYEEYLGQVEEELRQEKINNAEMMNQQRQMGFFNLEEQDNLIRWQLDLKEDMDRIYHLLKGESVGIDKETGSVGYVEPSDPNLKPFNEFGVQLIMNIMSFYLNRNTILSNYSEETINWKVLDFGYDLADLIFNRYDEMMITIDTDDEEKIKEHLQNKIKLYPMIIRELVDTVHSAYLRAYHGGERESLRTARMVSQKESLGTEHPSGFSQPIKKKWYNPTTW